MRKYEIYYYAEINDECVDCIDTVEAFNILQAIIEFGKFYKRIYKVVEVNKILDI
jgi:hypothetical protein